MIGWLITMMKTEALCYRCEEKAVSREHVPPLCMFPSLKYSGGENLRQNLITVPSCNKHNADKTNDDEFLMIALAGIPGTNKYGYEYSKSKIRRALDGRTHLINSVLLNCQKINVKIREGLEFPFLVGSPDYDRFISCFDNIAYGLYLHEFKTRFIGECRIIPAFVIYADKNTQKIIKYLDWRFSHDSNLLEIKGSNKVIFQYQFTAPDELGLRALKMTFYEGVNIFVSFTENGKKAPDNVASIFIQKGIKTIIQCDGENLFEFN
jgi:hypothetical protein